MKRFYYFVFLSWSACLMLLGLHSGAQGSEPPTHPFLRIETGHHAAMARRLVVDAANQRLVSAGDDKSIRIWQLPGGRLVQSIRLPMGDGQEGRPYAIAVSPDGRNVIVGGWTGWEWDASASVYFFDSESGEMTRRIRGLPNVVSTLNISPDGKTLAVGLNGAGGVRFFRMADGTPVADDNQFNDRVMAADFGPDGRLALVALDGYLRIYDRTFRLIGRQNLGAGAQPAGVRFSPDGQRIGISFRERPYGRVLSAQDLKALGETRSQAVDSHAVFAQVAWSPDSAVLYIAGDSGDQVGRIWSWRDGGLGPMKENVVSRARVADIAAMSDGGIAFSTEDPAVGIMKPDGARSLFVDSAIVDFRGTGDQLQVSQDGSVVQFPLRGKTASFDFTKRQLDLGTSNPTGLARPRLTAEGFVISRWKDSEGTILNGRAVPLDAYETSRSYAIAPDAKMLALGTEWSLRMLDGKAAQRWVTPLVSPAWSVTFSGDGKWVIAALGDGTLRWYRAEDGVEVMALFVHAQGQEWIVWLPSGYYLSSDYGDNFVGWQINRGKDQAPDFYRAVQFERILFRPDIVRSAFANRGADLEAPGTKSADRFDIATLRAIVPPRIRISATEAEGRLKLHIDATGSALPMQDFSVYVNNIPMLPSDSRKLQGADSRSLQRDVVLPLYDKYNAIRVEIFNGKAIGVSEQWIDAKLPARAPRVTGDLYLLAVGINHFENFPSADLAFAARDAEQVGLRFAREQGRQYRNTYVKVINDVTATKPLRSEVIKALDFVKTAKAEDTIIIFLASHGMSDTAGNYYFIPRDAQPDEVRNLNNLNPAKIQSLIPWTVFSDVLRDSAGRRLLVVDTCHSGDMSGNVDLYSLSKRSAASLFTLVSASKGDETSQEYEAGRQGLFTYAMLASLNESATDRNGDGYISISEMFKAAAPLVDRLRDHTSAQTPQIQITSPLGEVAIATLPDAVRRVRSRSATENMSCGTRTMGIGSMNADCL